jgi:hypothetical protein
MPHANPDPVPPPKIRHGNLSNLPAIAHLTSFVDIGYLFGKSPGFFTFDVPNPRGHGGNNTNV